MGEAEAIRIANRPHAKKRWAKTSRKEWQEAMRHLTVAREQKRVTVSRLQDTRTAQATDISDGTSACAFSASTRNMGARASENGRVKTR
jgi:hypothetical protein